MTVLPAWYCHRQLRGRSYRVGASAENYGAPYPSQKSVFTYVK